LNLFIENIKSIFIPSHQFIPTVTPTEEKPTEAALLVALEYEWQDHFQTRKQTWSFVQACIALAIGLVTVDYQLKNNYATIIVGILLVITAFMGCLVTLHHRNSVEISKFKHIIAIEKRLSLLTPDLFSDVEVPEPISWKDILTLRSNTSLFILRVHSIFAIFGMVYIIVRIINHY
jgi:hypothetical protein